MMPTLVLLGMKGAGKTILGRAIARSLGLPFSDLDELLAERAGCASAREAFLELGETGFRAAEAALLGELLGAEPSAAGPASPPLAPRLHGQGAVLSTGGGLCEAPGALGLLASARGEGRALLLYLAAPPGLLYARLEAALSLPAWLGSAPSLPAFAAVQARRSRAYLGLRPLVLDASLPPEALLEEALARLYADPFFAILVREPGRFGPAGNPDKEKA